MYDNLTGLHGLMAFLRDDFHQMLDGFEIEQLLTLNNEPLWLGRWLDLARDVCAEFGSDQGPFQR
jgi:hypothetical protein